jgi:hypothetical protein
MRACDDCRLCCKVFPVPVLQKPAGTWCRHTCASGCAIHGPRTPEICRQYDCYWREHDRLSEAWRPDRIGIVVTEAGSVSVGQRLLPVVLMQEDFVAASRGDAGLALLDYFVSRGFAVMVIHGLDARIEFDRARWPGISTDEIEAALCYELSQDADELKRLGAVGDEYRPLTRDEAEAACREERATARNRNETAAGD